MLLCAAVRCIDTYVWNLTGIFSNCVVCCSVLQCAAMYYSMLQYVAACCCVLLCVAVKYIRVWLPWHPSNWRVQCSALRCSALQCGAVCCSETHTRRIWHGTPPLSVRCSVFCSVIQFVAVYALLPVVKPKRPNIHKSVLQDCAVCCSALQCAHCVAVLQRVAACCSVLQRVAVHLLLPVGQINQAEDAQEKSHKHLVQKPLCPCRYTCTQNSAWDAKQQA